VAAELREDIAAYAYHTWPRPPLFDEPAPGTAWDHYRKAIEPVLSAGESLSEEQLDEANEALGAANWAEVEIPDSLRVLLASAEPAFRHLRRGACTRASGRFFDPAVGSGFEEDDPFGDAFRLRLRVRDLSVARAWDLAREGDPPGAVDTLLVLHRFGEDFGRGGAALPRLVGLTLQWASLEALGDLAGSGLLPDEALERVFGLRAREEDPWEAVEWECLYHRRMLEQCATGEIDLAEGDLSDQETLRETFSRVLDLFTLVWREARAACRGAPLSSLKAEIDRSANAHVRRLMLCGEFTLAAILRSQAVMFTVVPAKFEEAMDRLPSRRAALVLLIHALRFERREGRYPRSLEEVAALAGPDLEGVDLLAYVLDPETGTPSFYEKSELEEEGNDAEPIMRIR
jgi:hypothetical protein